MNDVRFVGLFNSIVVTNSQLQGKNEKTAQRSPFTIEHKCASRQIQFRAAFLAEEYNYCDVRNKMQHKNVIELYTRLLKKLTRNNIWNQHILSKSKLEIHIFQS